MRTSIYFNRYFKRISTEPSWWISTSIFLLLAITCCGLVYKASSFYERIYFVRSSTTENFAWSINQLEVEMSAVSLAIDQKLIKSLVPSAVDDHLEENDLDLWMDIFFSRIDSVSNVIQKRADRGQFTNLISELKRRAVELDSLVKDFNTSNMTSIATLRLRTSELQALSRDISVRALSVFTSELEQRKKEEEKLFSQFFLITLVLLIIALVTTLCVLFLWSEFARRSERMLAALDNQFRVFMSTPTGIIITEISGKIRYVNPSFSTMFGGRIKDFPSRQIQEFLQDLPKNVVCTDTNSGVDMLSELDLVDVRYTALRLDGSTFCAEISRKKIYDTDGTPILAFMMRDITLSSIQEDEIRAARDEAEKNAVAKSNFLATMSHEMRTPLHCATAALDLIELEALDDEQKKLIEVAKLSNERAIAEVNMVLDVSQNELAKHDEVDFSPQKVVAGILRELAPLAKQRNNKTTLVCKGSGDGLMYRGNARAFARTIYNLTSNAIKFTDNGNIEISFKFSKSDTRYYKLDVKVTDDGVGIAPKNREKIFEEFVSLETEEYFTGSNLGLGLPIARRAVASLGGELCLRSEIGVGSIFSFSILLELSCSECFAAELNEIATAPPHFNDDVLDVLVIDDKELNRELLAKMVAQLGHNYAIASNGLEAVSSACHSPYDVILIDDSMPVMGGREAVRHIRSGGPSKHSIIIGVTAYSDSERLSDFADAGADLVLIKPVKKEQLVEAFERLRVRKIGSSDLGPSGRFDFKTEAVDAFDMLSDALGPSKAFRLLDDTLIDVKHQSEYLLDGLSSPDAIADRLHSVIGTTAFAGLEKLSGLLRSAEISARNGNRDDLKTHYDQISKRITEELIAVKVMLEDVKDAKPDDAENMSSSRAG